MIHLLAAMLLAATAPAAPKNVILLIADGSGLGHFTFARNIRGDAFRIGTMPVVGVFTTQPSFCCMNTASFFKPGTSTRPPGSRFQSAFFR